MIENKSILLLGDLAIDRYHWGRCRDFNPEGPFPIMDLVKEEDRMGMAGNVMHNLQAFLPGWVDFISGSETSIKHRYVDLNSNRCLLRLDQDRHSEPITDIGERDDYDAIIISDYNKGAINLDVIKRVRAKYRGKIFIDTKIHDLAQLEGCTIKINSKEYSQRTSDHSDIIVTLGRQGALYQNKIYEPEEVDAFDVCGAGDTFLAALVAGWCKYDDMEQAIKLALKASAIAVQHIGTYALTAEDVAKICGS